MFTPVMSQLSEKHSFASKYLSQNATAAHFSLVRVLVRLAFILQRFGQNVTSKSCSTIVTFHSTNGYNVISVRFVFGFVFVFLFLSLW